MYDLEKLTEDDLKNIVLEYIRQYYFYDTCEILDDCLQFKIDGEKVVNVYINVERECEE